MLLALHGASTMHTNMLTDIRIANASGYDALEIWAPKLERYLDAGHTMAELLPVLGSLVPAMISPLCACEGEDRASREILCLRCERLCAVAQVLKCPAIQLILLDTRADISWPEKRGDMARSVSELATVAAPYGVSLAIEPVSFYPGYPPHAPLGLLRHALEVIDTAGKNNVGIVADIFHLWAAGNTWEEVAAVDPQLIAYAHIGDAAAVDGGGWTENDRAVLPGDGVVPLCDGVAAVRATGFDGFWSVEVFSPYLWEWDPAVLAREIKLRAETLLVDSPDGSPARQVRCLA